MRAMTADGSSADLERLSQAVVGAVAEEILSPAERGLRWDVMDRSGTTRTAELRSGMTLSMSTVSWERAWGMGVEHDASKLKLMLMRGHAPQLTTSDGVVRRLGGGVFHIARINGPVTMDFAFDEQPRRAHHEELSLEIGRERLRELLGSPGLPAPIERVFAASGGISKRDGVVGAGAQPTVRRGRILRCAWRFSTAAYRGEGPGAAGCTDRSHGAERAGGVATAV